MAELKDAKIELIVSDTLKILPSLPSNTYHLVVLDPPYLVTEAPNVKDEYHDVLKTSIDWDFLLKQIYRIMVRDSILVFFGHLSTFMELGSIIKNAGFRYVIDIIWVKPHPVNFLMSKRKPLSQHETITVWRKGKMRYNWQEALEKGSPYIKPLVSSIYKAEPRAVVNNGYRYMTDIIFAPSKPYMKMAERTKHPTQKPLSLVERLVKAFSFKGDNVLDPFAGSGTTLVACMRTGRNALGIEINEEYAEIIRSRVKNTQLSLDSVLETSF